MAEEMIVWLADLIERGVPDHLPLGLWGTICFTLSQKLYALAWRMNTGAPAK
jgi:hypothetical protein